MKASQFVAGTRGRDTILAVCAIFLACVLTSRTAVAQKQATETDPRVEQLYDEARAAEAQGDANGAIAKYKSIIEISPGLAAAYNNLGALYVRQRDYEDAVATLEKGLKLNPKMTSALALLGVSFYQMGDYARARPRLEAAVRANPKDSDAELLLAESLEKLGEPEAAESHFREIVRRDPKNQDAWYQLGKLYMQLSQDALVKLQQIDPDSVLVHEVSGEIMESMNNYDGAIVEYKKAVAMAPQTPGTHYKLGSAYWSISQWDAATSEFQAELANDPRNCLAQWKIGNIVLQQRGDADQALVDVNKALETCPNMTEAKSDRARALVRLNRPADALPDLLEVEKAIPDEPTVHYLLGQVYRALGRTQEAQTELGIYSKLEASSRAATASRAQQVMQNSQTPQQEPQQQPQR